MFTLQEQRVKQIKVVRASLGCCSTGVTCKACYDKGLGAEGDGVDTKAIQKEYGGQSTAAQPVMMGVKLAATVALLAIPVVGWAAALLLNVPIVGDTIMKPLMGPIAKMFKKATHMESCMKWWTESNIRGMASGLAPYAVSSEIKREYRAQRSRDMVDNTSDRQNNIANIFTRLVRENPDIMAMQCATMPQGRGETGMTEADAIKVAGYWDQLKEAARQEEYQNFVGVLGVVVEQKAAVVQESRSIATTFKLPTGVTSITKGGALVLMPGVSTNRIINYGVAQRK